LAREDRAKALLGDPIFNEAWDTLRQRFLDTWENSQPEDMTARENGLAEFEKPHRVETALRVISDDG